MLNLLPKGMIIGNIVDTLKKDPENGVVKLLEIARNNVKSADERALLSQVINYYSVSPSARMQIRNLVFNTSRATLYAFTEAIYNSLQPPINVNFLQMMTVNETNMITDRHNIFPVIDLKNLDEYTCEVLAKLKENGLIFFATIATTSENYPTVTSDEVIITLIRTGVRAIFYRIDDDNQLLATELVAKVEQIRKQRPILAFFMKKDTPMNGASLNYTIRETIGEKEYNIKLNLR